MKIDVMKACSIAIAERTLHYNANQIQAKIKRIDESNDYYVIDFCSGYNGAVYGGGGYLINKTTGNLIHYSMPCFPDNIMQIIDECRNVDIPEEFR